MRISKGLWAAGVGFIALTASTAQAQETAPAPGAEEEIVVLGKGYGVNVGGRSVAPLRETPNTVTIVDHDRIEQQNLFTITDLANQTAGLTVTGGDSDLAQFRSRGFTIDNYLVDGIPNTGFTGEIPDLFLYDRVEVLRGPSGLFSGSGTPAGSINLVRKRPLNETTYSALISAGSWDNYRAETDVSGRLSDSLNARGGVAYQDRDYFYDVAHQSRWVAFGVADFEFGPRTTLTVGANVDRYRGASFSGLPGMQGPAGQANPVADLDRSTYASADWNRSDFDTDAGFAELRHELNDDWTLRLSGQYGHMTTQLTTSYAISFTGLTPNDGSGLMLASELTRDQNFFTADINLLGSLTLFGRAHEMLFGLDYQHRTNLETFSDREILGAFDFYNPVYTGYPEPAFPPVAITDTTTEQIGLYGQGRFHLNDALTFVVGGRVSDYNRDIENVLPAAPTTSTDESNRFIPYGGLVWDATSHISLYTSYAETYDPQDEPTGTSDPLGPAVGEQTEIGVKIASFNDRLLTSLAAYRIDETGRAQQIGLTGLYRAAGHVRSEGFDLEVYGELAPGWTVTGGYNYANISYLNDVNNEGSGFVDATPQHSVKLWTFYQPEAGALTNWRFGGGIHWQSEMDGYLNIFTDTGARQESYTVVDALVGYDVTPNLTLAMNLNNIFDETYYERVSGTEFGNFYGAPRNVLVTARLHY